MGNLFQKQMLHNYQRFSVDFILSHPCSAIFLDCGLGKTIITLTALQELFDANKITRVLVVGPPRVISTGWPDEIERWEHLKGLSYSVAAGTPSQRKTAVAEGTQIVLIGRDNLSWLVNERLYGSFDCLVIDELSGFKAYNSQRSKAVYKMQPNMKRIIGLTGTPASNGLMDLFAEFKALDGGQRLGKYITRFRETYFRPGWGNGTIVYNYIPLPDAERRIYDRISDITVSMKALDYLQMPELLSTQHKVRMDAPERALYREMRDEMILELGGQEIDAKNAATLSGKLAQMANGAVYYEDGLSYIRIHDKKLDALEDLIEAANGKPVLVAYWFKHDRARILDRFPGAREIKTSADIHDWNERKIPVALIHPASAGHGLNLQHGGSTMIWFGLTWSLELYQQCCARLWRQGQQDGTVVICHIVTAGTIDEKIMTALEGKNATQQALIDAVKAEMKGGC